MSVLEAVILACFSYILLWFSIFSMNKKAPEFVINFIEKTKNKPKISKVRIFCIIVLIWTLPICFFIDLIGQHIRRFKKRKYTIHYKKIVYNANYHYEEPIR